MLAPMLSPATRRCVLNILVAQGALLLGSCSLIVDSKLGERRTDAGQMGDATVSGLSGEHGGGQEPFVIGERLTVPLDPQRQATQAMIGSTLAFAVPCPGQPDKAKGTFALSIPPFTASSSSLTKLFLVDSAGRAVLPAWDLTVRRLLVVAAPGQPRLSLLDADTLQALPSIDLGAPLRPGAPVLSPSGRYLAVSTQAGPMVVDLVRRVKAGLPSECGLTSPAFEPDAMQLSTAGSEVAFPYPRPERAIWCGTAKLGRVTLPERIEGSGLLLTDAALALLEVEGYTWLLNPAGSRWLLGLARAGGENRLFGLVVAPGGTTGPVYLADSLGAGSSALQVVGVLGDRTVGDKIELSPEGAAVLLWRDAQSQHHVSAYLPDPQSGKLALSSEAALDATVRTLPFDGLVPVLDTNLIGFSFTATPVFAYAQLTYNPTTTPRATLQVVSPSGLSLQPTALRMLPVPVLAAGYYSKRLLAQQGSQLVVFQDFPDTVLSRRGIVASLTVSEFAVTHHPRQQRIFELGAGKILVHDYKPTLITKEHSAAGVSPPASLLVQP